MTLDFRRDGRLVLILVLLVVAGYFLPGWLRYLLQTSLAGGLVALAVMIQMRAGLVSFGQGLYSCLGAYVAAILAAKAGVKDVAILLPVTILASALFGSLLGLLLSRYREIFFAMLSMALSMILYGVLVKSAWLGSTDGFNLPAPSYFGFSPRAAARGDWSYVCVGIVVVLTAYAVARYLATSAGAMLDAVAQNEIRLEYLGASPRKVVFTVYVAAAVISGIGGALTALSTRHIDPELANWTTSGGFVFVALLAGRGSVIAPVIGYFLLELVKTYALDWAPNAWQLILGAVMLFVILALPNGVWSLFARRSQ
ncbi:ABC transporter permease [Haematobacter missouriensis]|uniref:Branched-chain amino acid ABC transporter permease n=1 Tax=Haematobacter missouriensis TaxID=366616 RepID=A0ABX3ZWT5_9RHOB|nr:branched-chain amino acid ABC transporter permease [Haematobacter missouriensis]KFI27059.1 ABC transporter permease [Haematobacter missouriensis]OWJ78693.1 branched-chain amino acid ABC transporter permease [Haematobacter missouriensis]